MELNKDDYEVLREVALSPQLDKQQIADKLDMSRSSVGQRITRFREHSMVVKNMGSGTVKRCESRHLGGDVTYTEPYENDEFTWLITGKGEARLKEYEEQLKKRLDRVATALKRRKVYRPSHVLDE